MRQSDTTQKHLPEQEYRIEGDWYWNRPMPIVPLVGNGILGDTYETVSEHKDVKKPSVSGDKMNVTVEFTPAGKDQEIWEVIRELLLNQYLEENKIRSVQSEFEALHSIPLKGGSLIKGGNE